MAKASRNQFICQSCGATSSRWQGRCDACGEWNTLVEETGDGGGIGGGPQKAARKGRTLELQTLDSPSERAPRISTGIAEFDRVTGGGLVTGSAILIGGDPGIGKSTLLLQAAAALARSGGRVVYVSGEEAVDQIRMRAERLGLASAPVALVAETNVADIIATISSSGRPDLLIIDSIQTLWSDAAEAAPGTVTQVRTAAQHLIRYAKKSGAAVVLIGHVTKDGQIAGPRVVEHMVDAVLYFEGEGGHRYRLLRAVKNRFGPTDEIGVFEMTGKGLGEVANPSALFLGERNAATPGAAVLAGMEGTRPLLVEIQALVSPSQFGTARRAVVGWDSGRLAMLLAVLETHCGLRFGQSDVYLNVAGGLRIAEPAADLAVAAALVSSLASVPLPPDCVYFGEISLSGAVRPVAYGQARLRESRKLGFQRAVMPSGDAETASSADCRQIDRLSQLVAAIAALSEGKRAGMAERGSVPRSAAIRPSPAGATPQ